MYGSSATGLDDNFLACFQKGSTSITWSSYLGSNYNESLVYPTYFNSAYQTANTTIALNSQNEIYTLGSTTSYNTFPLSQWTGSPVYYQPTKSGIPAPGGTNDGTITRLNAASLSTITGLKDIKNAGAFFGIYPNPTAKNISITNTTMTKDDLHYSVYDMMGKKLKDGNLKANDAKNIDVSFLPQGVYIINVSNGKTTLSNKFVKTEN